MTVTITFNDGHGLSLAGNFGTWDDTIENILLGSVQRTITSNSFVYEDRWSGRSIEGTIQGNFVTSISVNDLVFDANPLSNTPPVLRETITLTFDDRELRTNDLTAQFNKITQTSGRQGDVADLFAPSGAVFDIDDPFSFPSPPLFPKVFSGTAGDDTFNGQNSSLTIFASLGDDTVNGSAAFPDSYDLTASPYARGALAGVTVTTNGTPSGVEVLKADGSIDTLNHVDAFTGTDKRDDLRQGLGTDVSYIDGAGGNDLISGGAGVSYLRGGEGNDRLSGLAGDDVLIGGNGRDVVNGGQGRDILFGGESFTGAVDADLLIGGGGSDLFVLSTGSFFNGFYFAQVSGPVVIRDFVDGVDFLGLEGTLDDFGFAIPGQTVLRFKDLVISQSGNDTVINDGQNDIAILQNTNAANITRRDFVEDVQINDWFDQAALFAFF